jgi:hypothetical protein
VDVDAVVQRIDVNTVGSVDFDALLGSSNEQMERIDMDRRHARMILTTHRGDRIKTPLCARVSSWWTNAVNV